MADLYSSEQSKRLFGFIGAGGSIGSILGPYIVKKLVDPIGIANLLLVASVLLVLAVICANRLERAAAEAQAATEGFVSASASRPKAAVGGGMFDGFGLLFKSGYLGSIGLWVFLLSFAGTFLYFILQGVVADSGLDAAARAKFFANIAQWVGILSLIVQLLATGRIISAIGTGLSAALVALVFVIGFIGLAAAPLLAAPLLSIAAIFQVAQRSTTFGIANLARESLWTVVSREEKFKAKNIVDGAVFRGADFVNAFIYTGLAKVMSVQPTLAAIGVVLAGGWATLSFALGRMQEKRARDGDGAKG